MRFINSTFHSILDYLLVVFLLLSPYLFQISGLPAVIIYVIAGLHIAVSLATAYPLGVFKLIPFRVHGYIELAMAFILVPLPWILNFEEVDVARSFFIGFGIGLFALWFLTQYKTDYEREKENRAKGNIAL